MAKGAGKARKKLPKALAVVNADNCTGCEACVEVCPVDCIHSDDDQDMYFIDPDECIDCGACESVCPVNAIYYEEDTPEEWKDYLAINANYFKK